MKSAEFKKRFPEVYAEVFPEDQSVLGSLDTSRIEAACVKNSEKTDKALQGLDAVKLLSESLVQVRVDGHRKR
jgi:hypothetical protein